jgi:hypothetical protein
MGAWSPSIMGGDTPLDIESMFEDLFGPEGSDRDDDGLPDYRVPTSAEMIDFIEKTTASYGDGEIVAQVTGFLALQRGADMSEELRTLVLAGIDQEAAGGAVEWDKPEERLAALAELRALVVDYQGGKVELPHQEGLFERIFAAEAQGLLGKA